MVYLVTGGTGFIGSYVVRDLARQGEEVIAYDISPNEKLIEALISPEERNRIRVIQGDLLDLPRLLHLIKEYDVREIVHMGSLLAVASRTNPWLAIRVNCEGTCNIFELAITRVKFLLALK